MLEGRAIIVDDARVRSTGRSVEAPEPTPLSEPPGDLPPPVARPSAYFEVGGRQATPAHLLGALRPGHVVPGPAILIDEISTIVVEPRCTAYITGDHDVRIEVGPSAPSVPAEDGDAAPAAATACDPIQLAIFSHRFMGIAEQMGRVLQRTSISVNIKERLDFSCALFDAQGALGCTP